ncbi:MAG: MFS transporter [Xanthobacteraceae bacterium]|nr:MFS transporter [Xanthobacteraceae bacterium]
MTQETTKAATALPREIWVLGFVSMLMDISSEMIHGLLPVYLVTVLAASPLTVGVIEGMAEATAAITKLFSGALSDRLHNRKVLTALGYGLAAATKPIFPLASTVGWVVVARFIDRLGKGIREAPRDALITDLAPATARGASFGLRQALDTVGAFIGPLLAIGLMGLTGNRFTTVFWVAVVPAAGAVALIVFAIKEPARHGDDRKSRPALRAADLRRLGAAYWRLIAIAALFSLARFSEAFLLLRASALGLPVALTPVALVIMNVAYAASAYPLGAMSDRIDRSVILSAGLIVLAAADLVIALTNGWTGLAAGIVLWGLHLGCTQGLLSAMVADVAPEQLRGSAFGVFHLVTGAALLGASFLAGLIWDRAGPTATFSTGAMLAGLALVVLLASRRSPLRRG